MFKLNSLIALFAFSIFAVEADTLNFEMKEDISL